MQFLRYWSVLIILGAAVVWAGCTAQIKKASRSSEEPLLLLEDDNGGDDRFPSIGSAENNYYCYECHVNYENEEFATAHAWINIGCQDCHGASYAHRSDEDSITPVDIMYPAEKIAPFCLGCHTKGKIDNKSHKPILTGTAGEQECFDCHGNHRLGHRTRRWDKKTGELILDDGVRIMRFDE